jgi:AICAR transformylase/IMP cyclohydrolase PurH
MTRTHKIARAVISVSDKTGLVELARQLAAHGVEILSTGGSAEKLRQAGIAVVEVGDYTGFPEMMDGRVKTLHPRIHGGVLQRRDLKTHQDEAQKHAIPPIDLIIVNLYPFRATVAKGANFESCIENIDIGGPAMVRSAAKNHDFVAIVTDPAQYDDLIAEMKLHGGGTSLDFRKKLAAAAYAHTASYDAAIGRWFAEQLGEPYPETLTLTAQKRQSLRYGENPHQSAAFYVTEAPRPGIASAIQIQGKELSYNNLNDTDAAFELVSRRSPSSSTPTRAALRAAPICSRPMNAPSPATPSARSAASLHPIGRSTPKPRKPLSEFLPKSSLRPISTTRRRKFSQRRKICACCLRAPCPIHMPGTKSSNPSPAVISCKAATTSFWKIPG